MKSKSINLKQLNPDLWVGVYSIGDASIITGINRTILWKLKQDGCNCIDKKTGVDLGKLKEWCLTNKRYPGALKPLKPVCEWELMKMKFQALREEIKYKVAVGELVRKSDVIESVNHWNTMARSYMESQLISSLPPKLSGKGKEAIEREMSKFVDIFCGMISKAGMPLKV